MLLFDEISTLFGLTHPLGFTEQELTLAENHVPVSLPQILRDYYQSLGKYPELNHSFNRLLIPEEWYVTQTGYLVFFEENQGVVIWGIKREDAHMSNPPVYGSYDNGTSWLLDAPSCSDFLVSMAYLQAVMGGLPYCANTSEIDEEARQLLQQESTQWHEISVKNNWYNLIYTKDGTQVISIFTDSSWNWQGVFIATSTEEAFQRLLDKLPFDWDYRSDEDD